MSRSCRAISCLSKAASRYSPYCPRHKANLRRHGAVDQLGIRKADLKPYLKLVRRRIQKNVNNPVWKTFERRWLGLVEYAHSVIANYKRTRLGKRHVRIAAYEILKLAPEVRPRLIVETAAAMVVMQEFEPWRFRSDRAFRTQLGRRVRGLANVNVAESYQHATGRIKRYYRELTPRSAVLLGLWLAETLGLLGLHIARLEKNDHKRQVTERDELRQALSKLV